MMDYNKLIGQGYFWVNKTGEKWSFNGTSRTGLIYGIIVCGELIEKKLFKSSEISLTEPEPKEPEYVEGQIYSRIEANCIYWNGINHANRLYLSSSTKRNPIPATREHLKTWDELERG